ncbi:MAG: hypothetical protein ACI8PT_000924 [Gammaproteobacteria bacterium]|jgi:hypothetical protein
MTQSRQGHLSIIRDPRQSGKVVHGMNDIVMLSIFPTVGGAEGWFEYRRVWSHARGLVSFSEHV